MADWHEYPTNYSNGTSIDGPADLFFSWPDLVLNGKFGIGLTLIIWIMTFTLSLSAGSKKATGIACFISFLFSLYFVGMGGMNLVISIALLIFGTLALVLSRDDGGSL
jgi:hypothetical protein